MWPGRERRTARRSTGRRGGARAGPVDRPARRRTAAARARSQGLQRDAGRADVPAHALFVDYRTASGRALEPEIFPRPEGRGLRVRDGRSGSRCRRGRKSVVVDDDACAVLAGAAGRISSALASAPITRRQACYRPVTDD